MTAIETHLRKSLPKNIVHGCMERLSGFPENEWFEPNNKGCDNDYDFFTLLHGFYLVTEKKITPLWHNGSFKGNLIQFRYRKDLEYTK